MRSNDAVEEKIICEEIAENSTSDFAPKRYKNSCFKCDAANACGFEIRNYSISDIFSQYATSRLSLV